MSTLVRGGPFVYASSLAIDVATMRLVPEADTIRNETRVVFERIAAQLKNHRVTLHDVVKTTCYVRAESDIPEFITAYEEQFPDSSPATNVVILGIAGNCRVQVEVVAVREAVA